MINRFISSIIPYSFILIRRVADDDIKLHLTFTSCYRIYAYHFIRIPIFYRRKAVSPKRYFRLRAKYIDRHKGLVFCRVRCFHRNTIHLHNVVRNNLCNPLRRLDIRICTKFMLVVFTKREHQIFPRQ